MITPEQENETIRLFKQKKVMTVLELSKQLACSIPTVRKRLSLWRTYTSYNKNGRYYVLPSVPRFDEHGLWEYRGVRFSRFGTLKQTVIQLVAESDGGLSSSEIGILVGIDPRSFMLQFRDNPELRREKIQGAYIYFTNTAAEYRVQKKTREAAAAERALPLPSDSEAIAILVDMLKHPRTTVHESAERLKRKKLAVGEQAIRDLLDYHAITLKKTPDTLS